MSFDLGFRVLVVLALAGALPSAEGGVRREPGRSPVEDLFTSEHARIGANPEFGPGDGAWLPLPPPRGRRAGAAVYDPVRDRLLLFGGDDSDPGDRNDVWALNCSGSPAWEAIACSGTPPAPRRAHSAIYDPVRDRLLVFGGFDGLGFLDDVWALELSGTPTWIPLAPTGPAPSARAGHTAVYDPARDRIVIFGGFDGSVDLDEVWALSLSGGEAWSPVPPSGTPPVARHAHAAIFDPIGDRMVVFGGTAMGNRLGDAWTLDFAPSPAWSPLAPTGTPPSPRYAPAAVYDPSGTRLVLFGGYDGSGRADAWELSLGGSPAWTELTPSGDPPTGRWLHSVVYDSNRDRLVTCSGQDASQPDYLDDSWALSLAGSPAWSGTGVPAAPSARAYHSAVLDIPRDRMIVFGGDVEDSASVTVADDVWALPLAGEPVWSRITPAGTPPAPRHRHSAIYDPVGERMIVFGGIVGADPVNEVWSLSLAGTPTWEQLAPTGTPPTARSGHSAIYDPLRQRMLVYGGTHPGFGLSSEVWELSLSGPPAWSPVATAPVNWLASAGHAALYDPLRDRMVVYGGDLAILGNPYPSGSVTALTLGGTPSWSWLRSGVPPFAPLDASAAYDPTLDLIVVYGGRVDLVTPLTFAETWVALLDYPTVFRQPALSGEPPAFPAGQSMVRDAESNRMIVFGGWNGSIRGHCAYQLVSLNPTVSVAGPPVSPLRLEPPVPNPGRDRIRITFSLPADSRATLDVFDVHGRRVRGLATGPLPAGVHSRDWRGDDERGRPVELGVYFLRLEVEGSVRVARVVWLGRP